MPVPPRVVLPPGPDETAVRGAFAALGPGTRPAPGEASGLHLFAVGPLDGSQPPLLYLGLTDENTETLAKAAGTEFAGARRRELVEALGTAAQSAADQVVAAVRSATRSAPGAAIALSRMPLGIGEDSGSGLAHSRDPMTGEPGPTGTYRANATGWQLLTRGGTDLAPRIAAHAWGSDLARLLRSAEQQQGHPVRVEFVVEHGSLWILSAGPARLGGAALVRAVAEAGRAGRLTGRQALRRIDDEALAAALSPAAAVHGLPLVACGLGVSPGAASGVVVFSSAEAVALQAAGHAPVLVLRESRPEDLSGLLACVAVVTERGGRTSHAAVVARGTGRPCVTALTDATVDAEGRTLSCADGGVVEAGTLVTVDGATGMVHRGARPPVGEAGAGAGAVAGTGAGAGAQVGAGQDAVWLLEQADRIPGPSVRVNADSAADAIRGRAAGATGVGLCRIEHMFLGERLPLLERVLLAPPGPESGEALRALEGFLRKEFTELLAAMDGLPVAVRLLDPPRHEFLPDPARLAADAAVARALGRQEPDPERHAAVRALTEKNPMLGVRGVRLGILLPELTAVQLRALAEAARALRRAGRDPRPEVLVPMVSTPGEVDAVRAMLHEVADAATIPLGVMIETPRAALAAGELAAHADFFSIGTNDLTALVWGLSRDDADHELLPRYRQLGILADSPLERWDASGVGELIRAAVAAARAVAPGLPIGVCGEHATDQAAVRSLAGMGITYLSCVAPLLPLLRLSRARAGLNETDER